MRCTDLRLAAARYFLGLAGTDYLVDVAHAALDRGVYAWGLGEIATSRNPIFADIGPLFESALRELNIQVSGWDEAIDILAQAYMEALAEGISGPQENTDQVYADYMALLYD